MSSSCAIFHLKAGFVRRFLNLTLIGVESLRISTIDFKRFRMSLFVTFCLLLSRLKIAMVRNSGGIVPVCFRNSRILGRIPEERWEKWVAI